MIIRLSELKLGDKGVIVGLEVEGELGKRLLEMGFVKGAHIQKIRTAPFGDPVVVGLKGFQLSLRKKEAGMILIEIEKESSRKAHPSEGARHQKRFRWRISRGKNK